jgi:hypothetical protein
MLALHLTVILHVASEHAHTSSHANSDKFSRIISARNSHRTAKITNLWKHDL